MNRPSVLAAVDFSVPARAAFDHALAISVARGAALNVVHAVPMQQSFGWRARARVALFGELRRRAEAANVRLNVSVEHGDPTGVILLHARATRPDLVVLGTHRRSGFDRLRRGSVAERVTLQASQPVLIVPAHAAIGATASREHIVAAVDFGSAADGALEHALAIGHRERARVTVVHVVPGYSTAATPRHLYRYGLREYQSRMAQDAWNALQDAVSRDGATASRVRARVVIGDPPAEIARVAAETDATLIVLGVTKRRSMSRAVFGPTTARVMRVAACPVLAVPDGTPAPPAEASAHALAA